MRVVASVVVNFVSDGKVTPSLTSQAPSFRTTVVAAGVTVVLGVGTETSAMPEVGERYCLISGLAILKYVITTP